MLKISTGKVKSAYRGGRIPLQGTWRIPTGDIAFPGRGLANRLGLASKPASRRTKTRQSTNQYSPVGRGGVRRVLEPLQAGLGPSSSGFVGCITLKSQTVWRFSGTVPILPPMLSSAQSGYHKGLILLKPMESGIGVGRSVSH